MPPPRVPVPAPPLVRATLTSTLNGVPATGVAAPVTVTEETPGSAVAVTAVVLLAEVVGPLLFGLSPIAAGLEIVAVALKSWNEEAVQVTENVSVAIGTSPVAGRLIPFWFLVLPPAA